MIHTTSSEVTKRLTNLVTTAGSIGACGWRLEASARDSATFRSGFVYGRLSQVMDNKDPETIARVGRAY